MTPSPQVQSVPSYATKTGTAYQCYPDGSYAGPVKCQPSPREKGLFLIPAGATAVAPPQFDAGVKQAIFNFATKTWSLRIAPATVSYSNLSALPLNAPMSMTPITTNSPSGFTITPSLPPGLALDADSGVISGTPTSVSSTRPYLIKFGNTTEMDSVQIVIGVISQ